MTQPQAKTRIVHGIPIRLTNPGTWGSDEHVFGKIHGALDLIATHQPRRLRRMRGDFERIEIRLHPPCRAAFLMPARTCLLDVYFVATFPPEQIASSVVHEGIHARIRRAGVRTAELDRAREERLCRGAELDFGLAIPGGAAVVERARASLALGDEEVAPTIDWDVFRRSAAAGSDSGGRPG